MDSHPRRTRLLVLLAILLALLAWLLRPQALRGAAQTERTSALAREYELFKTETRQDAFLAFEALSEVRNKDDLKALLKGPELKCGPDWTQLRGATHSCVIYVKSLNGVPTMYVNFSFDDRRLLRISTAVPPEAHEQGRAYLEQQFGPPVVEQSVERAGVRLAAWEIPDGSTLFYSRDRAREPYEPSSIQWYPKNGCDGRPCLKDR